LLKSFPKSKLKNLSSEPMLYRVRFRISKIRDLSLSLRSKRIIEGSRKIILTFRKLTTSSNLFERLFLSLRSAKVINKLNYKRQETRKTA
jgi:hypothetical protein